MRSILYYIRNDDDEIMMGRFRDGLDGLPLYILI